jgi:hypothetical protein
MKNVRVLVVEDEGIVALDIQNRLRQLGYTPVGRAASGEDALRLVEEMAPDLVLMDIRIQGAIDGIETARRISTTYDIPFIYLTAHTDEQTLQRAKATEPYGYLIKPFEERELDTTIEIALYKHRMEQTVRHQSSQLQQILFTVPEGILLLDPDFRVVMSNMIAKQHLHHLTGSADNSCVVSLGGYSILDLTAIKTSAFWRELTVGTGHDSRSFEVSVRPMLLSPSTGKGARKTGWLVVTRDVTDLRAMQKRSQQQDRLAAVGQLAAGIAHDFNNMIASINLAVEVVMMTQKDLTAANRDRLDMVINEGKRASEMIKQIMDFSRRTASEAAAIKVTPLIEELRRILQHTVPENIVIEVSDETTNQLLHADAAQITQALLNLSLNARDAMPNGGVLRLRTQLLVVEPDSVSPLSEMEPGDWLMISVSDTGEGISPDVLPHIFEPFFTTKAPHKGTGLGLAQVYGIVRQHRGYIDVVSRVGLGTEFTIYLPAIRQPTEALRASQEMDEALALSGRGETILLVEDNVSLRETMCEVLETLDYGVLKAANGREALEVLETHADHVKLVISDLIMPVMGGSELCREIKSRYRDLEIVVMTGYSPEEDIHRLKAEGILHWLKKPVSISDLSATVTALLQ